MNTILKYIIEEAQKHAERFQNYHNSTEIIYQRNRRRIKNPDPKEIKKPACWSIDKKYNPFYVLKHAEQIAKSIQKKLDDGTYTPFDPYMQEVPKKGGGLRTIAIYQIPDAAVSNYIYRRLLSKNKHRFSSLSYAYRNDRNVHYAIQDIALEFRYHSRLFISEFDFKDFFGSINHDYLYEQLDMNGFLISDYEKKIIKQFINKNDKGIPQGTSISLFLANLVCWKLDRRLEEEGLRFARYADDTLIWSNDYSKICNSFDIINNYSKEAGIDINFAKSDGISLLIQDNMPSEFYKTKKYIEFLGYRLAININKVGIKEQSVKRIKQQISYLLYRNLIQPIKTTPFRAVTIPSNNEDPHFVTAIMQIRRYLYGNLSEDKLNKFLKGSYKRLSFKGLMSFYPLVDDENQLRELDGWLVSTILHCLKLRGAILSRRGFNRLNQFPLNLKRHNIIPICKKYSYKGKKGLTEIPSFLKIYKAIKMGLVNEGIERTMNPTTSHYNY